MFINHLKIAFRQLFRYKFFSSLNILGLSLGMAVVLLIGLFIYEEYQYDRWMEGSEETYRVVRKRFGGGTAWTPSLLAQKLEQDYPEVAQASGFSSASEQLLTYAGNDLYIEETAQVDSTFFEVLKMELEVGNPATVLNAPNNMVITDRLAKKVFGTTNPIGETVKYRGGELYTITGLINTKAGPTHIPSDIFTRFTWYGNFWSGNNRLTYVRLKGKADPNQLAEKVDADVNALIEREYRADGYLPNKDDFFKWTLQPLKDVYLKSEGFTSIIYAKGSERRVYILAIIALLILAVAVVNYVNLSTARASQRSREVGVKKVTGAGRGLLATQFLTESVLQAVIASGFALFVAELALPLFNQIMDRELQLLGSFSIVLIPVLLSLALLIGLLAGAYPAFVMSAFQPVTALKAKFLKNGEKSIFRKVLVTGQFAVSITLLIVMAFIYRQVNYMNNQSLGFSGEQVMTIPLNTDTSWVSLFYAKERFKQIPGVLEVETANSMPGSFLPDWKLLIEGQAESIAPFMLFGGSDLLKCLDIELLEGRFVQDDNPDDYESNYVVNESFIRKYGVENPLETRIKHPGQDNYGHIIGVVKDFHFSGLNTPIKPLVMNANDWRNVAGIKLSTKDLKTTIASIQEEWATIEPDHPMRYSFLDDDFADQYAEQERFGSTILYACFLTIFIALLGLVGLTTFSVERRTKEIGVRKVLGASVSGIIALLARDFVLLISIACLIAIPSSYLLSTRWLQDFAYQTDLVWWVFAGASILILMLGFLTVAMQSFKAALTNPADSLKTE